jgi:DNA-binding IscR family transcriptional regulator
MISKKTKYALKALIYLAWQNDKGPILISDLLPLKNNGILQG